MTQLLMKNGTRHQQPTACKVEDVEGILVDIELTGETACFHPIQGVDIEWLKEPTKMDVKEMTEGDAILQTDEEAWHVMHELKAHESPAAAYLDKLGKEWRLPRAIEMVYLKRNEESVMAFVDKIEGAVFSLNDWFWLPVCAWFAERSGVFTARLFGGGSGSLFNSGVVYYTVRVQGVTLLQHTE